MRLQQLDARPAKPRSLGSQRKGFQSFSKIAECSAKSTALLAWDYFTKGAVDDEPQPVPADAWLDTAHDVEIIEHSICSREMGTVLSMLWFPERAAPKVDMF